jgi:hypothetical protein
LNGQAIDSTFGKIKRFKTKTNPSKIILRGFAGKFYFMSNSLI